MKENKYYCDFCNKEIKHRDLIEIENRHGTSILCDICFSKMSHNIDNIRYHKRDTVSIS